MILPGEPVLVVAFDPAAGGAVAADHAARAAGGERLLVGQLAHLEHVAFADVHPWHAQAAVGAVAGDVAAVGPLAIPDGETAGTEHLPAADDAAVVGRHQCTAFFIGFSQLPRVSSTPTRVRFIYTV